MALRAGRRIRSKFLAAWLAGFAWLAAAAPARAADAVPDWLYPSNAPGAAAASKDSGTPRPGGSEDASAPLRLPDSTMSFTRAQLRDLFSAPDWHPASHLSMPDVVAHGRAPSVCACGYCHTPTGQGRPENAPLAGLPVAYFMRQAAAFRAGRRHGAWPGAYVPADLMVQAVQHASEDELARAAGYFAQQTLRPRVRVVEAARVPRSQAVGLVYAALPGAGDEPLGERLMEFSPDPKRHELRDERMRYVAYVPPGSVARGRALARSGAGAACATCHGPDLKGVGAVPPLAGRSPTYLLRALYAFRVDARVGEVAEPMRQVAKALSPAQLIDAAAYAASLNP
jgi:cytochrome c553